MASMQTSRNPSGRNPIKTEIKTFTPQQATAALARRSERQRRLNNAYVRELAREMSRWRLNGEAIKFDVDDLLVDGQHRLAACALAGVSFETLVIYGVEADTFAVMDQNRPRFARDLYRGANPPATEAVARIRILRERVGSYTSGMFGGGGSSGTNWHVTARDLLAHMEEHEEIIHWGIERALAVKDIFRRRAVYGALIIDMAAIAHDAAEDFTARLASGEDLKKGDAVLALRRRLIGWTTEIARGHPGPRYEAYAVALIRTWNAHVRREPIKVVTGHVRPGRDFPQVTPVGRGRPRANQPTFQKAKAVEAGLLPLERGEAHERGRPATSR